MIDLARSDLARFFADGGSSEDGVDVFGVDLAIHDPNVGTSLFEEVIAARLSIEPAAVRLERDVSGRPFAANSHVHFSWSRLGSLALFAISRLRLVGVDIEIPNAVRFPETVSEFMLSARERRTFHRLPSALRPGWLARAWTCKEAIVKALGCGLQLHPASISVAPRLEDPFPRPSTWITRAARHFPPWSLAEFNWAGATVALACPGRPASLRFVALNP